MLIITQVAFGAVVILSGNKFMGVLLYCYYSFYSIRSERTAPVLPGPIYY
ncbi:hypothetical Protein YC6258_05828 [Gynuella sunshinyii YC6258]|uniref:Uncharacterized protein n=1 Tax=Gynuella sunshinyii YC6258 TaxID=1445510 RepID=A0A0C5VUM8_9GAMM|nr:hypothetical Protein YC6258_05828 [Gynuella sunshinyii YC6258]